MTDYFTALNGVKQGAVLSPILYFVYVDDLLSILSRTGVACFIGLHFAGAHVYADDLVRLAPTASAMRKRYCYAMISIFPQSSGIII